MADSEEELSKDTETILPNESYLNCERSFPSKRPICCRCKRPKKVCICCAFPEQRLDISTTIYVLQHPEERQRTLTTVPIVAACLPRDKCIVYNDVRYSREKYAVLHHLLKQQQTFVLYPDASEDLREVAKQLDRDLRYNLVVPDGTWRQARKIFKKNEILQNARKVRLNEDLKSDYVIRTQPTRKSLSTLEAIATALSILEGREEIANILRKPLQLLCDIQLRHGAVPHSSKEEKHEEELRKKAATK
ncbi:tRNA-uridine aminocarboxypropyltransferase 2-like isoform X2 [Xenia sp. Carnegie-2017]|uniref:tRNA-uridine aminocarboxypropyltransferase 2-like isoform X2 n=1 Tax=Xenia sp. Carnegie-2017 TaxID=2897299 RepID=UPI001F0379F6|nr:tRNA-uridine aminocarboxypropyltransferase 2-like isoform X2 [Xenia sp. Carnegie-2017]